MTIALRVFASLAALRMRIGVMAAAPAIPGYSDGSV
jgi:hypothetical protein